MNAKLKRNIKILKIAAEDSSDDEDATAMMICENITNDITNDDNGKNIFENFSLKKLNIKTFSDFNVLSIVLPFLKAVQEKERYKVVNYVENTVRNYIEDDFIMHFRLSRMVAYELISRFAASEMYASLRG